MVNGGHKDFRYNPDGHLPRGNPVKSRIKTIFLIRVTTSAERYCNEELFWLSQSASYSQAVPSRTTWRRAFDGPPTLERSGPEHRRAVTSPVLKEEGLGEEVEPLFGKRDGGDSKNLIERRPVQSDPPVKQ